MDKKAMNIRMNGVNEQDVNTDYCYSLEEELQIIKCIQIGGKKETVQLRSLHNPDCDL